MAEDREKKKDRGHEEGRRVRNWEGSGSGGELCGGLGAAALPAHITCSWLSPLSVLSVCPLDRFHVLTQVIWDKIYGNREQVYKWILYE